MPAAKRRQPPPTPRRRLLHRTSPKAGKAPGTLMHIGRQRTEPVRIHLIDYDPDRLEERELTAPDQCLSYRQSPTVSWIDIDGVHRLEMLGAIGAIFDLHPLVLEDIVNTAHRPKQEDFEDYLFLVLKMPRFDQATTGVNLEQISVILGAGFVLSFQEQPGEVFDGVRQRLRTNKGRLRKMGAGYLAYVLLDSVVDSYFGVLEELSEAIERLEEEIVTHPTPEAQSRIHHFKREMILLRKAAWPLRELLSGLQRSESALISESTDIYLRDVYDHTVQIIDTVETLRDILSGLLDLYMSTIGNRMNEIMKVLTIMATIFIPLTFIAGIYGMNFDHMPELHWTWSYPALWGVMIVIAAVMVIYFKRKRWL